MVLPEDSYSNSTPSFPSASTHRFFYAPPSSSSKVHRFPLDHVLSHSSPSFSFNLSDSAVIDLRLAELSTKPLSYTPSRSSIFSSQSHDLYHSLDLSQSFASDFSNISGELRRLSIIPDLRPNPSSNPEREPEPEPEPWPGFLLRDSFSTGIINSISPEDLLPTVKLCIGGLNSKSIAIRRSAAAKLRLLAKNRPDNRALIGDAGAIPALIRLLRYSDPFTQEHAVTALFNLSLYETNKTLVSNAGAVKPLIYVLKTGTEISKQNAACVLLNLALVDDKNKLSIGACGAIPPLVALLGSCSERGKKDALTTLYKLCSVKLNKERVVNAGAVRPLVGLVVDQGTGLAEKAMVVLNSLALIESGSEAIVEEGGIAALVEAIEDGSSDKGKEFAVLTLLQLCGDNFRNRDLLVREGGIPPLVALSQAGTAKAKHKMNFMHGKNSKGRIEKATSFIAPGQLAKERVHGQKTSKIVQGIGNQEVQNIGTHKIIDP